jgi:hypothetical protein
MPPRCRSPLLLGLLALWAAGPARAQLPTPRLQSVFPAGAQDATTIELQLNGADLEGADALWFDHPGIRAFHVKGTTFRVAVAQGVAPGPHDLRALGRLGMSNARVFVVGDRPETIEAEPNDTPEKANPIGLNSTANGRLAASPDVDCYAFEGRAGQRVFLTLEARRIESRLDGMLRLFGPAGRELAEAHEIDAADPMLDVTLPEDGRYVVKVQDVVYAGSADHVYRLTLHDGPHLDAIVPACARPGTTGAFVLYGRNLGGEPAGLSVDGRPLERRGVTITMPGVADDLGRTPIAPPGLAYRWTGPNGRSDALWIAEARGPVILEQEPNDDEHPQPFAAPGSISGTFGEPGDRDLFRFAAKKGDHWIIEVLAERLGSPADPSLAVQKVAADGQVSDLAASDDLQDFAGGSVDAELRWTAPEDGNYQIVVTDLYGTQRGDVRFRYVLNVRPADPDFDVFLVPYSPGPPQPQGITVRTGGRIAALAMVRRRDGFDGSIAVEARDLPPGLSVDPVIIGPGQNGSAVVVTAQPGAALGPAPLRLAAWPLSPDRKELLAGAPGSHRPVSERPRDARPLAVEWAATGQPQQGVMMRAASEELIDVVPDAPFLLTVSPAETVLPAGESVELTAQVTRRAGFDEAVQVARAPLGPTVNVPNATIAKDATSVPLKLTVPGNLAPGTYTIVFQGSGPFPFNKDPNAKDKPRVNVNEPSNTVLVRVLKK